MEVLKYIKTNETFGSLGLIRIIQESQGGINSPEYYDRDWHENQGLTSLLLDPGVNEFITEEEAEKLMKYLDENDD